MPPDRGGRDDAWDVEPVGGRAAGPLAAGLPLLVIAGILFALLTLNPAIRSGLSGFAGWFLEPLVGLGGHHPAASIVLSGILTALVANGAHLWTSRPRATPPHDQGPIDEDRIVAWTRSLAALLLLAGPVADWDWRFLHTVHDHVMETPAGAVDLLAGDPILGVVPVWTVLFGTATLVSVLSLYPLIQRLAQRLTGDRARA